MPQNDQLPNFLAESLTPGIDQQGRAAMRGVEIGLAYREAMERRGFEAGLEVQKLRFAAGQAERAALAKAKLAADKEQGDWDRFLVTQKSRFASEGGEIEPGSFGAIDPRAATLEPEARSLSTQKQAERGSLVGSRRAPVTVMPPPPAAAALWAGGRIVPPEGIYPTEASVRAQPGGEYQKTTAVPTPVDTAAQEAGRNARAWRADATRRELASLSANNPQVALQLTEKINQETERIVAGTRRPGLELRDQFNRDRSFGVQALKTKFGLGDRDPATGRRMKPEELENKAAAQLIDAYGFGHLRATYPNASPRDLIDIAAQTQMTRTDARNLATNEVMTTYDFLRRTGGADGPGAQAMRFVGPGAMAAMLGVLQGPQKREDKVRALMQQFADAGPLGSAGPVDLNALKASDEAKYTEIRDWAINMVGATTGQ